MISTYLGAENISLSAAEKTKFRDTLSAIGPAVHPSPAELMHWRTRVDGDAVLMRAAFQETDMTTNGLRQLLATVLAIPVAQVAAAVSTVTYKSMASSIVTMSVGGVDKMRFIQFAGTRSSVQQSNDEVIAYLKASAVAWGDA